MRIISGKFRGKKLLSPKTIKTRPTSSRLRETLFNIVQNQMEGATFVDLFAGSGAMGLEALSRGASEALFVDTHTALIAKNIALLELTHQTELIASDVFKALKTLYKQNRRFDIIFADPPYGINLAHQVLAFIDTHPLLNPDGALFLEEIQVPSYTPKTLALISKRKVGPAFLMHYTLL